MMQILIALWMTRSITDDVPGWGALFNGKAGDGTASVSFINLTRSGELGSKIESGWIKIKFKIFLN